MLYVGKAKNLKNRLKSYASKQVSLKTKEMLHAASQLKYQILSSELEALLIEAELIKTHQPPYNILLKDDKSPLYIIVTQEKFPRVLSVRKTDLSLYTIKAEFGPFESSSTVNYLLKQIRPVYQFCNAKGDKLKVRTCFYYHLNLCSGACNHQIDSINYNLNIDELIKFLKGNHQELLNNIKNSIEHHSYLEEFELAKKLSLHYRQIQAVIKKFKAHILTSPLPNIAASASLHQKIEVERLLDQLHLKIHADRIELYDAATLMGSSTTVSMVVAIMGNLDHNQYRHFSINQSKPNDFAALAEALDRRTHHPEWGTPTLIIVDGGKGQISAVSKKFSWSTPIIGLAKDPDRLVYKLKSGQFRSFKLEPAHPATILLTQLRNEAHRFSRRLHHQHTTTDMLD